MVAYLSSSTYRYSTSVSTWTQAEPKIKPIGKGLAIGKTIVSGEVKRITVNHELLTDTQVTALRTFYNTNKNNQITLTAFDGQTYACIWSSLGYDVSYDDGVYKKARCEFIGWSPAAPDTILDWTLAAPNTSGAGQLLVNWEVPNSNGSDLDGYTIQHKRTTENWSSAVAVTAAATATSATISSLTDGLQRNVRVRAENGQGDGSWSSILTAYPAAKPVVVSNITSTSTTNSITITWITPNQRYALTGLRVGIKLTTAASYTYTTITDLGATTHTFTGLSTNTNYHVTVELKNVHGTSTAADTNATTRNVSLLAAPANFTATPASTSIAFAWGAVTNATGYKIQYRDDADSDITTVNRTTSQRSYTVTGLSSSTSIQARVGTTNTAGTKYTAWGTYTTTAAGTESDPFQISYADLVTAGSTGISTDTTISANNTLSEWWFEVTVTDANSYLIEPQLKNGTYTVTWATDPTGWNSDGAGTYADLPTTMTSNVPTGAPPATLAVTLSTTVSSNARYMNPFTTNRKRKHKFKISVTSGNKATVVATGNTLKMRSLINNNAPFLISDGFYEVNDWHQQGIKIRRDLPIANNTIYYAVYTKASSGGNGTYTRQETGSELQNGNDKLSGGFDSSSLGSSYGLVIMLYNQIGTNYYYSNAVYMLIT